MQLPKAFALPFSKKKKRKINKKKLICFSEVPLKERKTLVNAGISQGDLAGIIIGFLFGIPFLYFLGVKIITSLKLIKI